MRPKVGIILLYDHWRAWHARSSKLLMGKPFALGNYLL